MLNHGVTFNLNCAKLCSPGIVEPYFSPITKDIWMGATDDYMHVNLIVLFSLTAILQSINFTS